MDELIRRLRMIPFVTDVYVDRQPSLSSWCDITVTARFNDTVDWYCRYSTTNTQIADIHRGNRRQYIFDYFNVRFRDAYWTRATEERQRSERSVTDSVSFTPDGVTLDSSYPHRWVSSVVDNGEEAYSDDIEGTAIVDDTGKPVDLDALFARIDAMEVKDDGS